MAGRPPYESLPKPVRRWVARTLGSAVSTSVTQDGGFSPGVAARVVSDRGTRAFVKSIQVAASETTATLYRREILAMQAIPESDAFPRLLASYDADGWIGLLFEDIEGHQPDWSGADRDRVLAAVAEVSTAHTPTPWPDAPAMEDGSGMRASWRAVEEADGWVGKHLTELRALQEHAPRAVQGTTLCHRDLRRDNILITDGGRVVFVDWAWACQGAPWIDTMQVVCDAVRSGADLDPDRLLAAQPMTRAADPDDLTAYLATLAGAQYHNSRRPPPPNLPTLRPYQRATSEALLAWLRRRSHDLNTLKTLKTPAE